MGKNVKRKRLNVTRLPEITDSKLPSSHHTSIILIIVLTLALYANTLKNGFVFDDIADIVNNAFIKDMSNLPKLFQRDYSQITGSWTYRPVTTTTFFLNYYIFGMKSWGYHLVNILLHAANGVLLYIFLTLLVKKPGVHAMIYMPWTLTLQPSLIITLLFTMHPILTEAVNGIANRADLLSFFFYITTLILYVLSTSKSWYNPKSKFSIYILSLLTYMFALLSKEMAVTLPLVIYCYGFLFTNTKDKKTILFNGYNMGYILLILGYIYLRFYYFYDLKVNAINWGFSERILTAPWLLLSYLKLTIFPVSLSPDYVIKPVSSPISPSFLWPLFSLLLLLVLVFVIRKKREFIFGTLFFFITLLPAYNIIAIPNPLAERYIYLPAAGFAIVIGITISSLLQWNKKLLYTPLFMILLIFACVILKRNIVWRDDFSLWPDTVRKMPGSSRAHNNLGNAYYGRREIEKALMEYRTALTTNPEYPEAHHNLGLVYKKMGNLDSAIREFQIALKLNPAYLDAYENIGVSYLMRGDIDNAILQLKDGIKRNPYKPSFYYTLGYAYSEGGNLEEAILQYQKTLELNPYFVDARYNLGTAYLDLGLKDKAKTEFELILDKDPNFQPARKALEIMQK